MGRYRNEEGETLDNYVKDWLEEKVDPIKVTLKMIELKGHALLVLGRDLLEPSPENPKLLKPKGFIKKKDSYRWEPAAA